MTHMVSHYNTCVVSHYDTCVCVVCHYDLYVLLKALPPVCMKYTAQGESQVANIVQGEAL